MKSENRITSCIKMHNGVPTLFINEQPVFTAAYVSYLEDRARYYDFSQAGYLIFSFPSYFAGRGINVDSGIGPFRSGIFDNISDANFSVFDNDVNLILKENPDAYIFPRICLDMPEWWDKKYPGELNISFDNKAYRESMSSQQWRNDATIMLNRLIDHIETSPYVNHIIGYQVAAGGTEEWVHYRNENGGLGSAAKIGFRNYVYKKYNNDINILQTAYDDGSITFENINIPENYDMYKKEGSVFFDKKQKMLLDFLEYTNWIVADDILYFCGIIKEKIDRTLITGAFYGYTMAITDARNGHHALKNVLNSNDIDFICSPNMYWDDRASGIDWSCMSVLDSIKCSGKLFINECDTRTHLTRPLKDARPSITPKGWYEDGVWIGPKSENVSKWLIRKCFARTLITGVGLWWFDMWGGWFASNDLMDELEKYIKIQDEDINLEKRESISEVAIISDEDSLRFLNTSTEINYEWLTVYPLIFGSSGTIYDVFDICNIEKVDIKKYKLIMILSVCNTSKELISLVAHCKESGVNLCFTYLPGIIKDDLIDINNVSKLIGINLKLLEDKTHGSLMNTSNEWQVAKNQCFEPLAGVFDSEVVELGFFENSEICGFAKKTHNKSAVYYSSFPEVSIEAIRYMLIDSNVHIYCDAGDVIYANHNYICIHAATSGKKRISLPSEMNIKRLLDDNESDFYGSFFDVELEQYETALFRIISVNKE